MMGTGSKTVPACAAAALLALLTALGSLACAGTARAEAGETTPRRLKIRVYEHDRKTPTVVVAVPLSLAVAALRIASHGSACVALIDHDPGQGCGHQIIDAKALLRAIESSGPGTLLEVRDHDQRVEIRLE